MTTAARIEELRKKFDENPRRYFAPLANELRKAGELTQAIALCREHLPKQPGHMSGYIVFGQALFEVGELDEARVVFEQALALDPENLIALHHLGHIARQQGDTPTARRWYERALETDPRNDDIAHQLAALATPVRPQVAVPTPVSPAAIDPDRELAFLEAGLVAPRRDLGAIPTPPVAQDAISSMPLAPTPDAAMRAVDFDQVNASLAGRPIEPIDIAFEDPVVPEPVIETNEPAAAPPLEETVASAASAALNDDPFVFADDELSDVPLAEATGASPVDLDAAFEEGLVTAGWPDPEELSAVATPRAFTPLSVEVTPDAAEAFGREAGDPVLIPQTEPEIDVLGDEADLTVAPAEPVLAAADFVEPVSANEEQADLLSGEQPDEELPWLAPAIEPADDVAEIAHAMEADARALGEVEEVAVSAVPVAEEAPQSLLSDETSFVDVNPVSVPSSLGAFDDAVLADEYATAEYAAAEYAADEYAADDRSAEAFPAISPTPAQSPAFVTETMGELLVAQGFIDRAVAVYEELVERRPYDPVLSARLAELREQLAASAPAPVPVFTARERYAALAARRVVRRTPVRPYTPVSTPSYTPAANARVSGAFTPIGVNAVAPRPLTPLATPAVANEESLASLFGDTAAGSDDSAAQTLADAFAPLPLDNGSPEGFANAFLGSPDGARVPTPAYGAGRQPTPVAVPPVVPASQPEAGAEFSFDRFFPDPAANRQAEAADPSPASPSQAGGDPSASEDLAQFSAWLKGLGQS